MRESASRSGRRPGDGASGDGQAGPPGEGRAGRVAHVGRRRLLQGAAALLLLGGSAVALVRTRGYTLPAGRSLVGFSAWQFIVVQHAARRIAAPDRVDDATIPTADDLDVAGFVDAW